jgi:hypothetical protein
MILRVVLRTDLCPNCQRLKHATTTCGACFPHAKPGSILALAAAPYAVIYAGDLPVLRCFKSFRLDKADLDAYIASMKMVL